MIGNLRRQNPLYHLAALRAVLTQEIAVDFYHTVTDAEGNCTSSLAFTEHG